MAVKRNTGVGDIVDKPVMRCCRCEGQADIPMPVANQDYNGASSLHGRYIPDPRGRMLCWDCYGGKSG